MSKANQAKSIAAKLSKISKSIGIPYQNIATSFLIERLLARLLVNSRLSKSLVFKGGYVGLRVYNADRYTVDLDALIVKADIPTTMKLTAQAVESDIGDGTWFELESQIDLKTQGEYGGVRQAFRAGIGEKPKDIKRSQVINFDVGIGDPVTPRPVKIITEELIGEDNLSWQVYPVETIIAEKLQTLIVRGHDNSRAKDIFDLHYFLPKADHEVLRTAVINCFKFRESELPANLAEYLSKMDRSMLRRGWRSAVTSLKNPPDFDEAFDSILTELEQITFTEDSKKKAKK